MEDTLANMDSKIYKMHIHPKERFTEFKNFIAQANISFEIKGYIIVITGNANIMKLIEKINQTFKVTKWGDSDTYHISDKKQGMSCYVDLFYEQ